MSVRIIIEDSARQHGITDREIRATIDYPMLIVPVTSRLYPDAENLLYVGRCGVSEPPLEVIAETTADGIVAFYAMYLRGSTVAAYGLGDYLDTTDLALKQRR